MAIQKPIKFRRNGKVWYHQTFTPDQGPLTTEFAIRLYDEDGDFVREFDSFTEMDKWLSANFEPKESEVPYAPENDPLGD